MFNFGGMPGGHGMGGRGPQKPVDTTQFYTDLGVEKSATNAQIKKAYRKLAMKHHPDRGGDPETFKKISTAYETLGDEEKRAIYNKHGVDGPPPDMFGHSRHARKQKGENVVFPLKVTLEELYKGTQKKLRLTKNVICTDCNGAGGEGAKTCDDCNGQGARMMLRQIGPGMVQQVRQRCSACLGKGRIVPEGKRCVGCRGKRVREVQKSLEVFVQRGMVHSERVVFAGEADEAPDTIPGDVVVVLQLKQHATFKREGPHLFLKKKITLLEALTGFAFVVTHLDGRQLVVRSTKGSVMKPGQTQAIREEGMPVKGNPYDKGNLYIEFDVEFPTGPQVTAANTTKVLASVLPAGTPMQPVTDPDVEEHNLVEVDLQAELEADRQQYDEDEDEEGGQTQCRAQ